MAGAGVKLAAAGAVAVVMAGGVKTHGGHGGIFAHFTSIHVPGGLGTPRGFAGALLRAEHAPVNRANMCAVITWEAHEGGGFGNQAANNPLNVNPGPGAGWPGYSAIGAWAFPDAQTGFRYTVRTLNNGYYPGIRAALRRGDSAQDVLNAIQASPWAASHYGGSLTPSC
jgi:hypothetical protein